MKGQEEGINGNKEECRKGKNEEMTRRKTGQEGRKGNKEERTRRKKGK